GFKRVAGAEKAAAVDQGRPKAGVGGGEEQGMVVVLGNPQQPRFDIKGDLELTPRVIKARQTVEYHPEFKAFPGWLTQLIGPPMRLFDLRGGKAPGHQERCAQREVQGERGTRLCLWQPRQALEPLGAVLDRFLIGMPAQGSLRRLTRMGARALHPPPALEGEGERGAAPPPPAAIPTPRPPPWARVPPRPPRASEPFVEHLLVQGMPKSVAPAAAPIG